MTEAATLWLVELILLVFVVAGGLIGWALVRTLKRHERRADDRQRDRLGDGLAFVGGALGIMLGLLLVFSAQHYTDAQEASRQEATRVTGLFNSAGLWGEEQRTQLRRDLICAARGLETADWLAADSDDTTGDDATSVWLSRVRKDVRDLDQSTEARINYYFYIVDDAVGLDKARQLRLLLRAPHIPMVIWVVIYTSILVFIVLLTLQIGAIRRLTFISLSATWLMLAVILGTLSQLDSPFTGAIGNVPPIAMESTLAQLRDAFPAEDWSACGAPVPVEEPGPDNLTATVPAGS